MIHFPIQPASIQRDNAGNSLQRPPQLLAAGQETNPQTRAPHFDALWMHEGLIRGEIEKRSGALGEFEEKKKSFEEKIR